MRWHHPISLFLKHVIMMGHVEVSQAWGAFEDPQLDQSFIHLSELCSDSSFWNAQIPCSCVLWSSLRQANLILVNPLGKQISFKKGGESRGCMRSPAFV